ncbi:enoyl-CoA hydratase/isomerase [Venturia nashicola]|uniref:Enoyl-CoA hydratase/isomerase n=1 Tax=Venturia nashicola TaxID=86259 RepID=A0A4Z1NYK5_9PEZI|nr:enoyl-CoA hydratase/isomerase [Venturia nashicola]TLD32668.1 enoyl-CoA hydratase/isomerase [Venturia nashicola]
MSDSADISLVKCTIARDGVALVELNRPKKRNALSQVMIDQLVSTLESLDRNLDVRAIVLTGSVRNGPFCAGVDLAELVNISTTIAHKTQFLVDLKNAFATFSKPVLSAVVGFALGGGFEVALASDMIVAAGDAKFGFPEIKIGTMPGAGGTQRLTRALGKQKAMEIILTGNPVSGLELSNYGLVNYSLPAEEVLPKALELARSIATFSGPVAQLCKASILQAEQTHLSAGLEFEKALYYTSFSYGDCKEGMAAFLEKRAPEFRHL